MKSRKRRKPLRAAQKRKTRAADVARRLDDELAGLDRVDAAGQHRKERLAHAIGSWTRQVARWSLNRPPAPLTGDDPHFTDLRSVWISCSETSSTSHGSRPSSVSCP